MRARVPKRVQGLHVKGGSWDIRAELEKRRDRSRGLVLAKSGALTLGFELNDGSTSVKPVGAEEWFRQEVSARAAHGWR